MRVQLAHRLMHGPCAHHACMLRSGSAYLCCACSLSCAVQSLAVLCYTLGQRHATQQHPATAAPCKRAALPSPGSSHAHARAPGPYAFATAAPGLLPAAAPVNTHGGILAARAYMRWVLLPPDSCLLPPLKTHMRGPSKPQGEGTLAYIDVSGRAAPESSSLLISLPP
jgi:hypothetical protein